MNVLEFDLKTGYLPFGRHKPSFEEFESKFDIEFPNSNTRSSIMIKYKEHCKELISLKLAEKQWVNGSYVTNMENPDDIDFLTQFNGIEMDNSSITKRDIENLTVDLPIEKDDGLCHSIPIVRYPEEMEELYEDFRNTKTRYLISVWGTDEEYTLKGIVEFDMDIIEGALIEK